MTVLYQRTYRYTGHDRSSPATTAVPLSPT